MPPFSIFLFFHLSLAECPYHLRQIRRQLYYNNIYFENMLECPLMVVVQWCSEAVEPQTVPHTLKCCKCAKVIKIFCQLQLQFRKLRRNFVHVLSIFCGRRYFKVLLAKLAKEIELKVVHSKRSLNATTPLSGISNIRRHFTTQSVSSHL